MDLFLQFTNRYCSFAQGFSYVFIHTLLTDLYLLRNILDDDLLDVLVAAAVDFIVFDNDAIKDGYEDIEFIFSDLD